MSIYLNSFRPLIHTSEGIAAARQFGVPPFVDGSCRREPDLQSRFPSISALCRVHKFAPRLHERDVVVYITKKGRYQNETDRHWRLTSVLQVLKRFETHRAAAAWYAEQGEPLPSNCMVDGNPALPLEQTDQSHECVTDWDCDYAERARICGVFLVCMPLFVELYSPPKITVATMFAAFGRIPGTRNPGEIRPDEFQRLMKLCGCLELSEGLTVAVKPHWPPPAVARPIRLPLRSARSVRNRAAKPPHIPVG